MNRINKLFQTKSDHILSIYFTAGHPVLESTVTIIKALQSAGADMIEIGIPFSDPMADGPVIQESSNKALRNGMRLKKLFEQISHIRDEVDLPLVLMGYLNPVLQYGMSKFCRDCRNTGVDGIIIPDLPMDIYHKEFSNVLTEHGLINIFLVTPQTSEDRIRFIDNKSNGFIYMVSSSSTTGVKGSFSNGQIDYFKRIKDMKLNNPVMAGFGISNHDSFETVCGYASGAIIGSAFIRMLSESANLNQDINNFIQTIRK